MTLEAKQSLKELNQRYFDDNIDEIIWSDEKQKLTIRMRTKHRYEFVGTTAKDIYKQLVKGSMHE